MKRLLFTLLALAFGNLQAEVLYWMGDASRDEIKFDFARVAVVKDGEVDKVICYLESPEGGPSAMGNEGNYMTGASWADITRYTSNEYGFFVEIMNYGKPNTDPQGEDRWFVAGHSGVSRYQDLVSAGHVYADSLSTPNISAAWAPTVVVPEPSGVVMILLGLAALNLRRRRA